MPFTFALLLVALPLAWGLWVIGRLGVLPRLSLALRPIALDTIPDRAAHRHGARSIFTCSPPCAWALPGPEPEDPSAWSAQRILETTTRLAAVLAGPAGVAGRDRVAILKENHFDVHLFRLAVTRAGGIACLINSRFEPAHLAPYLRQLGARVLVTDCPTLQRLLVAEVDLSGLARVIVVDRRHAHALGGEGLAGWQRRYPAVRWAWLEDLAATAGPPPPWPVRGRHDPLYLVHTSGTTGVPKAVILRNGPQSHAVRGWLGYVHVSPARDRGYVAAPANHQAVILTFNAALLLGLPVHWAAGCHRDDIQPQALLDELADGGYTGFFAFPVVYTRLKEFPLDRGRLRRMRFWASTADAQHESVLQIFTPVGSTFRDLGLPLRGSVFLDAQGSSEVGTPSVLRYYTQYTRRFGRRIGRPGSSPFGPKIRIWHADGRPAGGGEVGRLEVRGATVFDGYWNHHDTTVAAFQDRWFFTGDVATWSPDGHVVQLDREVDVIHTARGAVYCLPMEEVIHRHPAVFDCCVYGAATADGRQRPVVSVALRPGHQIGPEQLRQELNASLPETTQVAECILADWSEFPLGPTGKTLRREFRERERRRLQAARASEVVLR